MADNTLQTGTDTIATDELTTLNGGAVSGFKVQRVKAGFGSDGVLRDVDSANPLPTQVPDVTASATLTALNDAITLSMAGRSSATIDLDGAWTGTVSFEFLVGTTWRPVNAVSSSTSTPASTTTVAGAYRLTPAASTSVRARLSTVGTGSVTAAGVASAGVGGVFANQILPTKITDGVNTAAIKAASTAAVAADSALVVALSPNTPLPTGTNIIGALMANQSVNTALINGVAPLMGNGIAGTGSQRFTIASDNAPIPVDGLRPTTSMVTVTAASGVAATATIPAPGAGLFNYITYLDIQLYATAARTGGGTPVLVTSTNMPGSPVWNFPTAQAIGVIDRFDGPILSAIKSSVANTPTTIVAPIATSGIWRINVGYYTAA